MWRDQLLAGLSIFFAGQFVLLGAGELGAAEGEQGAERGPDRGG